MNLGKILTENTIFEQQNIKKQLQILEELHVRHMHPQNLELSRINF